MKKTSSILLTLLSSLGFQIAYAQERAESPSDSTHYRAGYHGHSFVYRCFHPHHSDLTGPRLGNPPLAAGNPAPRTTTSSPPLLPASTGSKRGGFGHSGSFRSASA